MVSAGIPRIYLILSGYLHCKFEDITKRVRNEAMVSAGLPRIYLILSGDLHWKFEDPI